MKKKSVKKVNTKNLSIVLRDFGDTCKSFDFGAIKIYFIKNRFFFQSVSSYQE